MVTLFLIRKVVANYYSSACLSFPSSHTSDSTAQLIFNSIELAIFEALRVCPNCSSNNFAGITFKLFKLIYYEIIIIVRPLNIIFQHSFYESFSTQLEARNNHFCLLMLRRVHNYMYLSVLANYFVFVSWKATGKSSL